MKNPRQIDGALVDASWRAARWTILSDSRSPRCCGAIAGRALGRPGANRWRWRLVCRPRAFRISRNLFPAILVAVST